METENQLDEIKPFVDTVMRAGNLDENQAKTLIYYAILTWSNEPRIRPIIDLNGESGTGKNGIMRQMREIRNNFFISFNFCATGKIKEYTPPANRTNEHEQAFSI